MTITEGPKIFFSYFAAAEWVEDLFDAFGNEWQVVALEIKLMESGGYRAGVSFEKNDLDLFGATEDA